MSETTGMPPEPDEGLEDEKVDEAMEGTFPASDPPSHSGVTGPGDGKED